MFPTLHHIDCRGANELFGIGIADYYSTIKFVVK